MLGQKRKQEQETNSQHSQLKLKYQKHSQNYAKIDTAYDELSYHRGWKANVLKATREPLNREEKRSNILLLK